ncbi:hypothetical protein C8F04DRAFT_1188296 [Mycena alexandri]|uniref:Uncharacterized protein n=1 Tax=Mycena alexandri TaxID=1745969 RepID=A0AAD6WY09_9AGAR|nr:hypothetical protein C8F04DRAFT_1188296 [Mycena alexandri]
MANQTASSSYAPSLDGSHASRQGEIKEYEFWMCIARLMTRTRLAGKNQWIGTDELVEWNRNNLGVCARCKACSVPRKCVIDDGHPSCRTCRTAKANCERKIKFLFDLTKGVYYPDFETFKVVYKRGPQESMAKFKALESRRRRATMFKAVKPSPTIESSPSEPLPVCEMCARMYDIHNTTPASSMHRVMSIHTPQGIENAPEFEGIRAIQTGLSTIWSKLGSMYLGHQGSEAQLVTVRELMRKFCQIEKAYNIRRHVVQFTKFWRSGLPTSCRLLDDLKINNVGNGVGKAISRPTRRSISWVNIQSEPKTSSRTAYLSPAPILTVLRASFLWTRLSRMQALHHISYVLRWSRGANTTGIVGQTFATNLGVCAEWRVALGVHHAGARLSVSAAWRDRQQTNGIK